MQPILRFAAQAARNAGRELISRSTNAPSTRSVSSALTEYFDRSRNRALRNISQAIQRSYPDHQVYSSEDSLDSVTADYAWVVEPVSGTLNFMRRSDQFCTVIAVLRKGRFTSALIIDHFRDGQYHVTRSEGCFSNSGRMRVSDMKSVADGIVATSDLSVLIDLDVYHQRVSGCVGLDIVNTASGKLDAMVLDQTNALQFHVARLFIREAGGFGTALSGGEWQQPSDGLIAGSTFMHRKLVASYKKSQPTVVV